jgi:hypothetical protein
MIGGFATAEFHLVTEEAFPRGVACMSCHKELPVGSPFGQRLEGVVRGTPIVSLVCVYCAVVAELEDEKRPA